MNSYNEASGNLSPPAANSPEPPARVMNETRMTPPPLGDTILSNTDSSMLDQETSQKPETEVTSKKNNDKSKKTETPIQRRRTKVIHTQGRRRLQARVQPLAGKVDIVHSETNPQQNRDFGQQDSNSSTQPNYVARTLEFYSDDEIASLVATSTGAGKAHSVEDADPYRTPAPETCPSKPIPPLSTSGFILPLGLNWCFSSNVLVPDQVFIHIAREANGTVSAEGQALKQATRAYCKEYAIFSNSNFGRLVELAVADTTTPQRHRVILHQIHANLCEAQTALGQVVSAISPNGEAGLSTITVQGQPVTKPVIQKLTLTLQDAVAEVKTLKWKFEESVILNHVGLLTNTTPSEVLNTGPDSQTNQFTEDQQAAHTRELQRLDAEARHRIRLIEDASDVSTQTQIFEGCADTYTKALIRSHKELRANSAARQIGQMDPTPYLKEKELGHFLADVHRLSKTYVRSMRNVATQTTQFGQLRISG